MPCEWFNSLREAATIAKAAPMLALIRQVPQPGHVLSVELKRMVNSDPFESIIHLSEVVSQL